jgi:TolA-binding protein
LILDQDGKERWRLEGYLTKDEFRANLEMGLARIAFMRKKWADAGGRYNAVIDRFPDSHFAPEAVYWRGVSEYKATNDHVTLEGVAKIFTEKYTDSVWAIKSQPWLH